MVMVMLMLYLFSLFKCGFWYENRVLIKLEQLKLLIAVSQSAFP
jgi:hypothetical protein